MGSKTGNLSTAARGRRRIDEQELPHARMDPTQTIGTRIAVSLPPIVDPPEGSRPVRQDELKPSLCSLSSRVGGARISTSRSRI